MSASPDTQLENALRERGLRVTPQRVLIHRAVTELDRHVTADEVLDTVSARRPNPPPPPVYAPLELLEELGMVRRLAARSGAALYDPRTDEHQHLVCRRCGRVARIDVPADSVPALRAARKRGFHP